MNTRVNVAGVVLLTVIVIGMRRLASSDEQAGSAAGGTATADQVRVITNSIGMKLAYIPAGKFMMGSPRGEAERNADEVQHEVTITKPFYVGVYEVTQAQFANVMGEKARAVFNSDNGGGPDHPMENVLWVEAAEFCSILSARDDEKRAGRKYRLPTEAEWEYACRAGTTTAFHCGNSLSSRQANFNGDYPYGGSETGPYLRRTTKVGSYEPNAFGLYDMHGNVAEWCADWYDPNYYNDSPDEDPLGPPVGVLPDDFGNFYVVVRGGCWLDDARACRSAYRFRAMHRNRYWLIGFRVACDVSVGLNQCSLFPAGFSRLVRESDHSTMPEGNLKVRLKPAEMLVGWFGPTG